MPNETTTAETHEDALNIAVEYLTQWLEEDASNHDTKPISTQKERQLIKELTYYDYINLEDILIGVEYIEITRIPENELEDAPF